MDTTNSLTTLTHMMTQFGLPLAEQELIEQLIDGASWAANSYTNRKLKSRALTEYYDGDDSNLLVLNQRPVTAVASVYVDSAWEWGSDTLVDSDDYQVYEDEGLVRFVGTVLPSGARVVKVTYTAGYATIPYDVERAVQDLAFYWYKQRTDKGIGVLSRSTEGRTVSYAQEIPQQIKDVFDVYRKVWVL